MRKLAFVLMLLMGNESCSQEVVSTSGVAKATAKVKTGSDGLTGEQRNVSGKLEKENAPGSIKHLYVISAMSGQTILYSTVREKPTSSGKRLSPATAYSTSTGAGRFEFKTETGVTLYTNELLGDDGTYGKSIPYLYWFDVQGRFHQHYVTGGQIIHVSDEPIDVPNIIINMELAQASGATNE